MDADLIQEFIDVTGAESLSVPSRQEAKEGCQKGVRAERGQEGFTVMNSTASTLVSSAIVYQACRSCVKLLGWQEIGTDVRSSAFRSCTFVCLVAKSLASIRSN